LNDRIIEPYVFEETLNAIYYNFLENHLPIENVELHIRGQVWFQQDGTPAHSTRTVQNLLNKKYPHRWIGCKGSVAWSPRSLDLMLLDYFLWGM